MGALSGAAGRPAGEIPFVDVDAAIETGTRQRDRHDIRDRYSRDTGTTFDADTDGVAAAYAEADGADVAKLREHLQRAMIEGAGVLRSPESLVTAAAEVGAVAGALRAACRGRVRATGAPSASSPTS